MRCARHVTCRSLSRLCKAHVSFDEPSGDSSDAYPYRPHPGKADPKKGKHRVTLDCFSMLHSFRLLLFLPDDIWCPRISLLTVFVFQEAQPFVVGCRWPGRNWPQVKHITRLFAKRFPQFPAELPDPTCDA